MAGGKSNNRCTLLISQRQTGTRCIQLSFPCSLRICFTYCRWLAVRLEFIGNLMVFFAALLAMLADNSIDSAIVGLSISYALNVSNNDFSGIWYVYNPIN